MEEANALGFAVLLSLLALAAIEVAMTKVQSCEAYYNVVHGSVRDVIFDADRYVHGRWFTPKVGEGKIDR